MFNSFPRPISMGLCLGAWSRVYPGCREATPLPCYLRFTFICHPGHVTAERQNTGKKLKLRAENVLHLQISRRREKIRFVIKKHVVSLTLANFIFIKNKFC